MILSVNIDHIATIRQARRGHEPDPVTAAAMAVLGGAEGVTLHLREDRRHVNDRDLNLLRDTVHCELNLEMAATDEMITIAGLVLPDLVTLVPENRQELTTEGGIDLSLNKDRLQEALKRLHDYGMPVSVFINPLEEDVAMAKEIGFDMVEIHTGFYADSRGRAQDTELLKVIKAVKLGSDLGILTNAGHGLNYHNVGRIAAIKDIRGLYIGHSIISRSVFTGIEQAVRQMKSAIREIEVMEYKDR